MNLEKSKQENNPKNVMGWDVQQSKVGYYMRYRKQVNTIYIHTYIHTYIGKEFNKSVCDKIAMSK